MTGKPRYAFLHLLCCVANLLTQAQGLGTVSRPKEVAEWMKWGRKLNKPPAITDISQFSQSWWGWWQGLQPAWRLRDSSNRPLISSMVGDHWGGLVRPGKNGLLLVLLTLAWWKNVCTELTLFEWEAAVADVSWVVSQMASGPGVPTRCVTILTCSTLLIALISYSTKRGPEDMEATSARTRKRQRR